MTLLRVLVLFAVTASAALAAEVTLVLGTATPGGGFTAYGEALADAVAAADPTIELRPQQTAGSKENIPLLQSGRIDVGLVEGTAAYEVLRDSGNSKTLLVVAAMYPTPAAFAVRADSPYRSINDLKGRRVVFGASGSGFVTAARYVLEGLGLDMEKDFDAVLLKSAGEGPPMVIEGKAAAMWGGGVGWPAFRAIAESPAGARLIAPNDEEIARIRTQHPFLKPMTLPAGSYRGQDRDVPTVGTWSLILARPGLAEETAHRLARALHRAQPGFGLRLPQAAATTPENTALAVPRGQLHPGVVGYFKELGIPTQ
jgi:TRAP transporter TAXI family solute receptor